MSASPPAPAVDRDARLAISRRAALRRVNRRQSSARMAAMLAAAGAGGGADLTGGSGRARATS